LDGLCRLYVFFSLAGFILFYALQRLQGLLPFNPQHLLAVGEPLAFNTAVSFVTNTDWQPYAPETACPRLGEEVHLSPKEWSLLRFLVSHAGRILTHRQLLEEVWGPANVEDMQYRRVFMRPLRRKLEPDAVASSILSTEVGVGYRLLAVPAE
jgi:DNA-binding response OmpR family regulator